MIKQSLVNSEQSTRIGVDVVTCEESDLWICGQKPSDGLPSLPVFFEFAKKNNEIKHSRCYSSFFLFRLYLTIYTIHNISKMNQKRVENGFIYEYLHYLSIKQVENMF